MALIKSYKGLTPKWGRDCYFSENATIVGEVTMGDECSIWFNAVVRGDVAPITIGDRTNVQDGSCVHVTHETGPTIIGSDVTIGHNVTVHACTIKDGALIGMGATLLDGCEVGERLGAAEHQDSSPRDLGRCACQILEARPSGTDGQLRSLRGVRQDLHAGESRLPFLTAPVCPSSNTHTRKRLAVLASPICFVNILMIRSRSSWLR